MIIIVLDEGMERGFFMDYVKKSSVETSDVINSMDAIPTNEEVKMQV